jgi:hypothetical protein
MSNPLILKIPQFSDRAVLENFSKITENYNSARFNAQLIGQVSITEPPFDATGNISLNWAPVLELQSSLISSLTVNIGSIVFTYRRGGSDSSSAIFDDIVVNINANVEAPDGIARLQLISVTKKLFKAFDPERTLRLAVSELELQAAALHESTLNRLEETTTNLVQQVAQQQIRLVEEYREKGHVLEAQLQESKAELQADFDKRISQLRKQEEELATRQASIDDRDNTHARRETRNKLLEDVRNRIENFGVTAATEKKRLPVSFAFLLIILGLFYLIAATWSEIRDYHDHLAVLTSNSVSNLTKQPVQIESKEIQLLALTKTDLYILWGRLSLAIISLIGIALYYIRWQNRWAEQHSIAEFQLQQFYLDVNRANWVVESGLEWHKETSTSIPNELLDRLTHNLFKAAVEPPAAIHPADELASALLGSASKLKLKAGNSEIEFDKPGKIPDKT